MIDDFAHHPTAIRKIIQTLKGAYPEARLWTLFEPRSNTTRRRIFQQELTDAFSEADVALFGSVARENMLAPEERLDLDALAGDLRGRGLAAEIIGDADRLAAYVSERAQPGDVVAILSNGGFGGVHQKIMVALSEASA